MESNPLAGKFYRNPLGHDLVWERKSRFDGPIYIANTGFEEYCLSEGLGVYITIFSGGDIKYSFRRIEGVRGNEEWFY